VSDIMQQDGGSYRPCFFFADFMAPGPDDLNGLAHQVHGTHSMLESGMIGPGVDKVGETQLPDSPQPLKEGMLYQFKGQIIWDFNKSIDRIIDDFQFVGGRNVPHAGCLWDKIMFLLP
jgi:hypothetical protein